MVMSTAAYTASYNPLAAWRHLFMPCEVVHSVALSHNVLRIDTCWGFGYASAGQCL